jgi:cytochrome c biogenesis factor
MTPAANFFGDSAGISTPDVLNRPDGDLYATLVDFDSESATLAFDTSPLIGLLWLGGLTAAAGGFASIAVRKRERKAGQERQKADV